jgi:hypothetical protein
MSSAVMAIGSMLAAGLPGRHAGERISAAATPRAGSN